MTFLKKIFSHFYKEEDDFFEEEENLEEQLKEEPQKAYDWDWDTLTKERALVQVNDPLLRNKYIRNLVEQIKDASGELDKLSYEYNIVTATLKDMDEIDALPQSEKQELQECAGKILYFEDEKKDYQERKNRMSDAEFYHMEQFADAMPKAYDDIRSAEEYNVLIKDDLSKLDGEKHAFLYRKSELYRDIENCRGMVMICMFAMVLCVIMLLILQFGFGMETRIGYVITALAGAVAISILYVKYLDHRKELEKIEKGMNRIILLQNTVKIRYVNNVNLLDYLCMKYHTKSAKELEKRFHQYEAECKEREQNRQNEEELNFYQKEILRILRRYQLSDVRTWLHQPRAILDTREMVEIRHEYIIRRQKLRARIDYNKRLAHDGEKEIKKFTADYPQYAREVLTMMSQYS